MKRLLTIAPIVALSGCVSIHIPEDLPENANIDVIVEVNVSGYKSAAGRGNLLEVKTDATLPLLGKELNTTAGR